MCGSQRYSKSVPTSETQKKIHLEGLRGFAALIVVIHHFSLAFYPRIVFRLASLPTHSSLEGWFMNSPLYVLVDGNFAVSVFFALSGYVLTFKLIARPNRKDTYRSLLKRYFRLTPSIFLAVILSYLLLKLGLFSVARTSKLTGSQLWLGQLWHFSPILTHALWVGSFGAYAHVSNYITVLWSMHYEFLGSVLCIVLASLSRRRILRLIAYAIATAFLWHGYFFGMLIGTIVAEAHLWISTGSRGSRDLKAVTLTGPLLFVVGLYLGMYPQFGLPDGFFAPLSILNPLGVVLVHSLGAACVLGGLLASHHLQRIFGGKAGAFVGRISFSVYLLHTLVLGSFACWYFEVAYQYLGYNLAAVSAFVLSLPIIFAVALMATRLVDQPSVVLANRIGYVVFPAPRRKRAARAKDFDASRTFM